MSKRVGRGRTGNAVRRSAESRAAQRGDRALLRSPALLTGRSARAETPGGAGGVWGAGRAAAPAARPSFSSASNRQTPRGSRPASQASTGSSALEKRRGSARGAGHRVLKRGSPAGAHPAHWGRDAACVPLPHWVAGSRPTPDRPCESGVRKPRAPTGRLARPGSVYRQAPPPPTRPPLPLGGPEPRPRP